VGAQRQDKFRSSVTLVLANSDDEQRLLGAMLDRSRDKGSAKAAPRNSFQHPSLSLLLSPEVDYHPELTRVKVVYEDI
jgi:hypothetical protein